ncbi:Circadian input kinase A [Geitlerinema sp. FC II]|nr:Circadian input kinase A [Geitlerinema sp. FC II]
MENSQNYLSSSERIRAWEGSIANVALQIHQEIELNEILQTTANEVRQLLECDRVLLYQFEADWSGRVVVEAVSDPERSLLNRVVKDACFEASWIAPYREGRFYASEDITQADISPCHAKFLAKFDVKANLVVPILQDKQLWGLLIAHHCTAPRRWSDREIRGLQQIAVQMGIALQQATLIAQLKAAKAELEAKHKTVETELHRSQNRLLQQAAIVESSQDAIVSKTLDGIITSWNPAAEKLFGYSPEEIVGTHVSTLIPPDRQDEETRVLQRIRQGKRVETYETQRRHKNGSLVDVALTISPIRNRDGRIVGASKIVRDLRDRKREERLRRKTERALHDNRAKFQAFMTHLPLLSWLVDRQGIVSYANPAWLDFVGRTEDSALGRSLTELFPADLARKSLGNAQQVFQTGEAIETLERTLATDGKPHTFLLRQFPVYQNRHIAWVGGIAINVTARQQTELELHDSQAQLEDFLDNATDLIQSVSLKSGKFLYVNRAWLTTFGYDLDELSDLTVFDVISPNCLDRCQGLFQQLQSGEVVNIERIELEFLAKDGRAILLDGSINVRTSDGAPIATRAIFRDVTAQRRAETLLQEQANVLRIFYESSPLMMGVVEISDNDILHVYHNPATLEFFSVTPEAMTNAWSSELGVPQTIVRLWLTHYRQSQQQGQPVQFDYQHATPTQTYWLLAMVSFIGIAHSDRPQFSYIIQDLSPRKQLEDERQHAFELLNKSQQRYESLVAAVPVGIFRTDATGQCVYVNDRWCQIVGLSSETAVGNGWVRGLFPDDRDRVAAEWSRATQNDRPFQLEYRFQHPGGGRVTWVYGQAIAERNSEGEIVGYVGTITDISDRKQAEAERLNAEQTRLELKLLEQILEIVLAGYWDWDIADNREYLSPGFKRMFGYEDSELPNSPETWQNLIFPEDLPKVLDCFEQHVRSHGEIPFHNEVRYRHKDGSTVWVICSGQVIEWDADGKPLRAIGCHIDISDRKQVEAQLHNLSDRLQLAVKSAQMGIWDWDIPNDELVWDDRMYELYGIAPSDFAGVYEAWEACVHPEDLEAVRQCLQDALEGQRDYDVEFRAIWPDGTVRAIEAYALVQRDSQGQPLRTIGVNFDVTDRTQAEAALKESEARFRYLADCAPVLIWMSGRDKRCFHFNTTWLDFTGRSLEQEQGDGWLEGVHPEDLEFCSDTYATVFETRQSFEMEYRLRRFDGQYRWLLNTGIPRFDADGEFLGYIGSCVDITDRKQAEIELVAIQKALKTSEMQLSGILNSSLNGIMAFRSVRDKNGAIVDFEWLLSNPTACATVGRKADDLIGKRMLEELPGNREEGLFDLYVRVVNSGEPARNEFYYNHDGIDCWFENISVKLGDGFAVTFRDITAIKQSEQALQQANQQLEDNIDRLEQRNTEMLLLSETSDFLQACLTIEEACAVITSLVEPLFPNCSGGIFITSASRNRIENVAAWGKHLYSQTDFHPQDCWGLRRGRSHWVNLHRKGLRCNHTSSSPETLNTLCIPTIAQGETIGLFYLSSETPEGLSEEKQQLARTLAEQIGLALANLNLRETLQHQSIRDPLTGLFNRRYLEEFLQQEISRAQRRQHSIGAIMLDVDRFKQFNDTYGHDAGDLVLQAVGNLLKNHVRGSDVACRYGGEEMTLVLPECSLTNTQKRAEALREAISTLNLQYQGKTLDSITASFGVACFPQHGITGQAVLQAADAALYRAKAEGRNRVAIAPMANSPEMENGKR